MVGVVGRCLESVIGDGFLLGLLDLRSAARRFGSCFSLGRRESFWALWWWPSLIGEESSVSGRRIGDAGFGCRRYIHVSHCYGW